jgi:DNA-binding beta-propeller fold protein YncE
MDRREFLVAAAAVPLALSAAPRSLASNLGARPLALVTADLESHVVVLDLETGRSLANIPTGPGPRSIESVHRRTAVVAHTQHGVVSLIASMSAQEPRLAVRRELETFAAPRYTAAHPRAALAYVTDSSNEEVVTLDVDHGRVLWRTAVPGPARHVSLSPDGRTLWTSLGSTARLIAVLDTRDARRPRLVRTLTPPFLAHDVVFAPGGTSVWVTSGSERRLAVYSAAGDRPTRLVGADAPPQHVAFAGAEAFVASGDDGTLRRHRSDGRLLGSVRVPLDSYNVTFAAGRAVTPSLGGGIVTILDPSGRIRTQRRVAKAAHDACVVVS